MNPQSSVAGSSNDNGLCIVAQNANGWLPYPAPTIPVQRAVFYEPAPDKYVRPIYGRGPWTPIFSTWLRAIPLRDSFTRRGATEVSIVVINLNSPLLTESEIKLQIGNKSYDDLQYPIYKMLDMSPKPKEVEVPYEVPEVVIKRCIPLTVLADTRDPHRSRPQPLIK